MSKKTERREDSGEPGRIARLAPPPAVQGGETLGGDKEGVKDGGVSSKALSIKDVEKGVRVKGRFEGRGSAPRLCKLDPKGVADALDKHWPNMFQAALACGVVPNTFYHHRDNSPWFQRIYRAIETKHNGLMEAILYKRGVSGEEYTFNDRCMYLKAHMPELYDRAKVIKLEDNRVPMREAAGRARLTQEAVDAELVDDYRSRKALKALRRREAQGDGGSGQAGAGGKKA